MSNPSDPKVPDPESYRAMVGLVFRARRTMRRIARDGHLTPRHQELLSDAIAHLTGMIHMAEAIDSADHPENPTEPPGPM